MSRLLAVVAALVVVTMSFFATQNAAYAHERRMVGPYAFVVGWLNEPTYQYQPNAATVRISDTRVNPAKPIEGLTDSLKIEVFQGGLTRGFSGKIHAVFGQPGMYAVDVIPTVSGSYKYKISGKVESMDVNETFESGPNTFDDIVASTALQYPETVPGGLDLSRRLDALQSTADQTRLAAIAGIILAVVSIGLGFRPRRG